MHAFAFHLWLIKNRAGGGKERERVISETYIERTRAPSVSFRASVSEVKRGRTSRLLRARGALLGSHSGLWGDRKANIAREHPISSAVPAATAVVVVARLACPTTRWLLPANEFPSESARANSTPRHHLRGEKEFPAR